MSQESLGLRTKKQGKSSTMTNKKRKISSKRKVQRDSIKRYLQKQDLTFLSLKTTKKVYFS